MSKHDALDQVKELVKSEVKKELDTRAPLVPLERPDGSFHFKQRGYHYLAVPSDAYSFIATMIGGGGGSGGGGSGGSSVGSTSGGGGGGGAGGGDGEHHIWSFQSHHLSRTGSLIVYVGRGGAGGLHGHSVAGNTANDGINGAFGATGRPTFIWGNLHNVLTSFPNQNPGIPTPDQVELIAIGDHTSAGAAAVGITGMFSYARGGPGGGGGFGGLSYDGGLVHTGHGGTGGTGVYGFISITSGGGGGGGAFAGLLLGGGSGPIYNGVSGAYVGSSGQYDGYVGAPGSSGGMGNFPILGDGGFGGFSNPNIWDPAHIEGYGGRMHDYQPFGGIDFPGDLDPESLESSSNSDLCSDSCESFGLSLGGAGGAGAGFGLGRQGANVGCPSMEMCDCTEVTRAANGLPGTKPQYYGAGAGGPSGGSGMFLQSDIAQPTGSGGCGVRGATGHVHIRFFSQIAAEVNQPLGQC